MKSTMTIMTSREKLEISSAPAGNSAAGDRDRKALFAEVLVPVYEGLRVRGLQLDTTTIATLADSTTLAANLRYQPEFADWLVLQSFVQ